MHHRHEVAVRGGDHVDHLVRLGQFLLHDDHREGGSAGGDVAGAGTHGVRRDHAGAGVAFRRAQRHAGLQVAGDVQPLGARLGQETGLFAGAEHLRQDVTQLPREALLFHELLELLHHVGPVVPGGRVHGQHAGGVAHAQHLLAGELPVDVAGQGGEIGDLGHVLLAVQDGLVQVGDAPAERNVVDEQLGQFRGGGTRVGVPPGAEGNEQAALLVERHVPVHHRADADGAEALDLHVVLLADVGAEVGVALLEAEPDEFLAVGPEAVHELVFPLVAALGDGDVVLIDQDGLDAGGAELDAEDGPAGFDGSSRVHVT